jgi:hypothetical protein
MVLDKHASAMSEETRTILLTSINHQLGSAKDDYRSGRIDQATLKYIAKHLRAVENQVLIEYNKSVL